MPDERQDSIRQGISAPPESPTGQAAAEERRERAAHGPRIGGAMGGTSDAERAGEEADMDAKMHAADHPLNSPPSVTGIDLNTPDDRVGG